MRTSRISNIRKSAIALFFALVAMLATTTYAQVSGSVFKGVRPTTPGFDGKYTVDANPFNAQGGDVEVQAYLVNMVCVKGSCTEVPVMAPNSNIYGSQIEDVAVWMKKRTINTNQNRAYRATAMAGQKMTMAAPAAPAKNLKTVFFRLTVDNTFWSDNRLRLDVAIKSNGQTTKNYSNVQLLYNPSNKTAKLWYWCDSILGMSQNYWMGQVRDLSISNGTETFEAGKTYDLSVVSIDRGLTTSTFLIGVTNPDSNLGAPTQFLLKATNQTGLPVGIEVAEIDFLDDALYNEMKKYEVKQQ